MCIIAMLINIISPVILSPCQPALSDASSILVIASCFHSPHKPHITGKLAAYSSTAFIN